MEHVSSAGQKYVLGIFVQFSCAFNRVWKPSIRQDSLSEGKWLVHEVSIIDEIPRYNDRKTNVLSTPYELLQDYRQRKYQTRETEKPLWCDIRTNHNLCSWRMQNRHRKQLRRKTTLKNTENSVTNDDNTRFKLSQKELSSTILLL